MTRHFLSQLIAVVCMLLVVVASSCASFDIAQGNQSLSEKNASFFELLAAQTSCKIAEEGIVLLENDGALPLGNHNSVALFGIGSIQTTKGGTGSGAVDNRIVKRDGRAIDGVGVSVSIYDGFIDAGYEVLTENYLKELDADNPLDLSGMRFGAEQPAGDTLVSGYYSDEDLREIALLADTAIYTVRRNAGESIDRVIENDYCLSEIETSNIEKLASVFEHLVVVLNVVSCDVSWFEESGADALVLVSNPGMLGGDAIVDVLTGRVNPSGKLADTWARSIDDWPSTSGFSNINAEDPWAENLEFYAEDVFVGYRYFDTFAAEDVLYEFGYGLSYTTFDIVTSTVNADEKEIRALISVTNTGNKPGKEVVQVYFSAPDGKLFKPYQELAAFCKTKELEPGESQVVSLSFPTVEMSSYSEELAANVLERGEYVIRVGNSSRNTKPVASLIIEDEVIVDQLANQMSLGRYGAYPGGSSDALKDTRTISENISEYEKQRAEFQSLVDDGEGLNDEAEALTTIVIPSDGFKIRNPYVERNVDPETSSVNVYLSSTTERDAVGLSGYDPSLGEEYEINVIDFGNDDELDNYRYKDQGEASGFYTLFDVQKGLISLDQFVSGLTISEMADIVMGGSKSTHLYGQSAGGRSGNTIRADDSSLRYIDDIAVMGQAGQTVGLYIESRGIPSMTLADGPAGLRLSQSYLDADGVERHQYCTAFPTGSMLAQTWNVDLAQLMGYWVGAEMKRFGVSIWLAPGMNIHRNPLCARNYEYFSEDPLVSGVMAAHEVDGVQFHPGLGVTLKHMACNNQENGRKTHCVVVSERALREIYLKQFEIAVKTANPMCVMSSYGIVNSVPTANDYELFENILRTEWGFKGLVMTDWGGSGGMTYAQAFHSGNDLMMPGGDCNRRIIGYLEDCPPAIEADSEGFALCGGYPETSVIETTISEEVRYSVYENWGDYYLSSEGSPFVVRARKSEFETVKVPHMLDDRLVETTVKEIIDDLALKNKASYVIEGDAVLITYLLRQYSTNDGTRYSPSYKLHPCTIGSTIFGEPDYNPISLGDLQKSTKRVLSVAMRTTQWQECLDEYEATTGENMEPYAVGSFSECGETVSYFDVEKL